MNFDKNTSPDIRNQILSYVASSTMSDVERAKFLGLPEGCRIREHAKILSPEKLIIGEYCWIGEGAILDASGNLTIGSHTSIGLGVYLWTHDSHQLNIRGQNTRDAQSRIKRKPTRIGSHCFIAGPSVVLPGVTIGDKCIIAPMSVVDRDLPDRTIFNPRQDAAQLKSEVEELRQKVASLEELIHSISATSSEHHKK